VAATENIAGVPAHTVRLEGLDTVGAVLMVRVTVEDVIAPQAFAMTQSYESASASVAARMV
jgi:hypothetical protein